MSGNSKASELVPGSLFPRWNSMRFFARGSLYDTSSLVEVRFATIYTGKHAGVVKFSKSWFWTVLCWQNIHHIFFSHIWGTRLRYFPDGFPYMLMYSALHIMQWFSGCLDVFIQKIRWKFFAFYIFMNQNKWRLHKTWDDRYNKCSTTCSMICYFVL